MTNEWLVLSVGLPLFGAVIAAAWPRRAELVGLLSALVTAAAALAVVYTVGKQGPVEHALGGWTPGLGIALRADALSALMLGLTGLVALAASVYASAYFTRPPAKQRFWPLWLLLWTSLNALLLSGDLFNLYVTLELLGIAAVALAALGVMSSAGSTITTRHPPSVLSSHFARRCLLRELERAALQYPAPGTRPMLRPIPSART